MSDKRLDTLIVERGLVSSRTQAQKMILGGQVSVYRAGIWELVTKPSAKFDSSIDIDLVLGEEQQFVSRAGIKLSNILKSKTLSVKGLRALDVGQSTGGFTDCLIKAGVDRVVGIDVGHGQLHPSLIEDKRVVAYEGINARSLPQTLLEEHAPKGFDIVVMDVSFISQSLILPGLVNFIKPGGSLISLVKPQFEVGKEGIGKGGLVKNKKLYAKVENNLKQQVSELGLLIDDYLESSIKGGDGNTEFFILCKKCEFSN